MRDCFRQYPEIYGAELEDDDDDEAPAPAAGTGAGEGEAPESNAPRSAEKSPKIEESAAPTQPPVDKTEPVQADVTEPVQEKAEESTVIPKKAVDATDANIEKK